MEVFHLVNSVGHLGGNFSFTKMLVLELVTKLITVRNNNGRS